MIKVYAHREAYGRHYGVIVTRERPNLEKGYIEMGSPPRNADGVAMLGDLESQMEWKVFPRGAVFQGAEQIYLPAEQVQAVFDALWEAGMRPRQG